MIKRVIILDNHVQGLGLSRLAERNGLEVLLFSHTGWCITRFSNTCKKFFRYKNENDLLNQLLKFHSGEKDTILMPTNDRMVDFIVRNHESLHKYFYIPLPSPDITEIAYNKIKTYRKAAELNIPIPESYFPENQEELENIASEIKYPVVLKPAVMHQFYSKNKFKMYRCNDSEELQSAFLNAKKSFPDSGFIVQEMLAGGPENLYSFGSFCSGQKVWTSFTANRIRQKPMDFGVSTTFAQSVVIKEIEELSKKFLTGIDFFGISEVEYMFDDKTNTFKLLEINPRTWKWHSMANILDIDLLDPMIRFWEGKSITERHNIRENLGWIERLTDFSVSIKEIISGRMSLGNYFSSLRITKESAVISKKDPLPAIMYILISPVLFFKR